MRKNPKLAQAIGRRVEQAMEYANMNQTQLALAIGSYSGDVSQMVNGKKLPCLPYLQRVADALGVRLRDLVDPVEE